MKTENIKLIYYRVYTTATILILNKISYLLPDKNTYVYFNLQENQILPNSKTIYKTFFFFSFFLSLVDKRQLKNGTEKDFALI